MDLTGKVIGRYRVIERDTTRKERKSRWICECSCGVRKSVIADNLLYGNTRSCGCLSREQTVRRSLKHGFLDTPTYSSWRNMKARCSDENRHNFDSYGGRGIRVCDRWVNSFANFLADMGPRPEGTTLDRVDPDGNYEPGNCRWADSRTQHLNKRRVA